MAKAIITEYASAYQQHGTALPLGQEPAVAVQAVTYTTATQSAAFGSQTRLVRIIADADANVLFGANPTADADDTRLEANQAEYFGVRAGQKVSVYDGTS